MGVFAPRKKCRSFISDPSRRWFAAIFKQVPFLPWYSPIRRFDTGRREVPVKQIKKRRETVGGGYCFYGLLAIRFGVCYTENRFGKSEFDGMKARNKYGDIYF